MPPEYNTCEYDCRENISSLIKNVFSIGGIELAVSNTSSCKGNNIQFCCPRTEINRTDQEYQCQWQFTLFFDSILSRYYFRDHNCGSRFHTCPLLSTVHTNQGTSSSSVKSEQKTATLVSVHSASLYRLPLCVGRLPGMYPLHIVPFPDSCC
jgi:hypothetical protein